MIGGAPWDVRTAVGSTIGDTLAFRALQVSPRARTFDDCLINMIVADTAHYGGAHRSQITSAFANHDIDLPVPTVTISGPSSLPYMQSGTWTASVSGGVPPYHHQWWYRYPKVIPVEVGPEPDKPPAGYWYQIGTDSPKLSHRDSLSFELKCVVTDDLGTEVTSTIKFVFVGSPE